MPHVEENYHETCVNCGGDINREVDAYYLEDEICCQSCYIDESFTCYSCGERYHNDHSNYIQDTEDSLCNGCFESSGCWSCERCYDLFSGDRSNYRIEGESYCSTCYEGVGEPQVAQIPKQIPKNDLQSEEAGKVLTSKRLFGVELECVFNKTDSISRLKTLLDKKWGIKNDGSIRMSKNSLGSAEIVSPIMSGKTAEAELRKIDQAHDLGFRVNKSCGFHVHLNCPDFKREPKDDQKQKAESKIVYVAKKKQSGRVIEIKECPFDEETMSNNASTLDFEKHIVEGKPIVINPGLAFQKLKDLWYVYLAFDDVFRSMLPPSRRGNGFCKATSSHYSIENVRDLRDYTELEVLWYKIDRRRKMEAQQIEAESRKRGKDYTRYVGFNLEPLLRYNSQTIEIRYHSATLNSEKILRWIDLHQTIIDYVSSIGIDTQFIEQVLATETHIVRKAKMMCRYFKIKKETEEWIMARLHKFNQINEVEVEDEETEDSELGRPNGQRDDFDTIPREIFRNVRLGTVSFYETIGEQNNNQ